MISGAYWISPDGQIIPTDSNYINDIISAPEKFGLTSNFIDGLYKKFNEHPGVEGEAREQIIVDLLEKGWIRLRKYAKSWYWGCTIWHMTPKKRTYLKKWTKLVNKQGEVGSDVKIVDMSDNDDSMEISLDDLMENRLDSRWPTRLEQILEGNEND